MQVEALANSLHIRFLAPKIEKEHETWTMKNIYNSWAYNVQYWKNGSDEKVSLENRVYLRYGLPVLCSVLVWGHCSGERRTGGHLVRVLQGGNASKSRGSKAWSSERASSQPEGWAASPAHTGGKFTEQTFRVLAQLRVGLSFSKGKLQKKAELTQQLAGGTYSQLNRMISWVTTVSWHEPCATHTPQDSQARGQAAPPWTLDEQCQILPVWAHFSPLLSFSGDSSFKNKG